MILRMFIYFIKYEVIFPSNVATCKDSKVLATRKKEKEFNNKNSDDLTEGITIRNSLQSFLKKTLSTSTVLVDESLMTGFLGLLDLKSDEFRSNNKVTKVMPIFFLFVI